MYRLILFLFCLISFTSLQAQDRLFSQFYASPMLLNPALTGAFDGRFRVSTVYREQWGEVLEDPYSTFAGAVDLKWGVGKPTNRFRDIAAVGLVFYNDKVSGIDFSTTQLSVSGAYHKSLSARTSQYLSLGIQTGIAQRNVNYERLTFEDQFNGTDGYTDPTAEPIPENNFSFGDFSVGLNYSYTPKARTSVFAGFAIHHFLTPSVSFFGNEEVPVGQEYPSNQLFIKYSGQLSFALPLTDDIQFLPRAIFSKQGPHEKIDAGANFRFSLSEYNPISLHLGGYARPVRNDGNSFSVSDIVALVGIEYNNVLFGFSYDLNLDDLSNTQAGQRAFEFSIAYLGEYQDDLILCPKF